MKKEREVMKVIDFLPLEPVSEQTGSKIMRKENLSGFFCTALFKNFFSL